MAGSLPSSHAPEPAPLLLPTALSALLTRGVLLPVALLQGALLARGLGPSGLGSYTTALVDVNLLVALLSLGLPGGLAMAVGAARGRADAAQQLLALRRLARRHGLVIAALLLGMAPLYPWLRQVLPLPSRPPLLLALVATLVLFQFVRDVQNALLWGGQRFAAQNRINLGVQLLLSAALLGLWAAGVLRAESALGLQLAAHIAWIAAAKWAESEAKKTVAARSSSPIGAAPIAAAPIAVAPTTMPSDPQVESARRVGLRSYIGVLLDLLLLRIDIYLIERLVPAASMAHDLGLYQAGVRIAELVLFVPSTLNAVLFAKAAAREDVTLATLRGAKLSLWLGLAALISMWLVGQPLLLLFFGQRFAGSFVPCLWVLAGCVATCFSSPLAGTLSGEHGYPKSVLGAQLLSLIANVVANLYLLPRYGIVGAAMASALSYALSALLIAAAFAKRYRLSPRALLWPEAPWRLWQELRRAGVRTLSQPSSADPNNP